MGSNKSASVRRFSTLNQRLSGRRIIPTNVRISKSQILQRLCEIEVQSRSDFSSRRDIADSAYYRDTLHIERTTSATEARISFAVLSHAHGRKAGTSYTETATPTSPRPSPNSITFYVITARAKYTTTTRGYSIFFMS